MNKLDLFLVFVVLVLTIMLFVLIIKLIRKKSLKKPLVFLSLFLMGAAFVMIPFKKRIANRIQFVRSFYLTYSGASNVVVLGGIQLDRDGYKECHLPMAMKVTKKGFIKTNQDLVKKLKSGRLIPVEEGDGFCLLVGPNSSAHLTPLAKKRLFELGRLFRSHILTNENKKDYFVITSLTRTEAQQQVIRIKYPRQATKGPSTHSYGVSFDISQLKSFADPKVSLTALESALKQMQSEKKILLCPESTCIHVTVIN